MSLNFGFNVGVRSGHHRHPNTVEAAELLQECILFLGHSVELTNDSKTPEFHYTVRLSVRPKMPNSI